MIPKLPLVSTARNIKPHHLMGPMMAEKHVITGLLDYRNS